MYSKGSDTKSSPKLRRAAFVVGGLTGLALMTSAGATAQTLVTSSSSNRLEIFNANRASGSYGDLLSSVGYAYDLGIALGDNGTIYYASGPTGLTNESIDSLSPTGQIKTLVNATVPFGGAQKLQYYDGTLYGMGYYHGIFSVDPTTGVLTNSSVFGSTFANNHNLTFSSVFAIKSNGDFVFGNNSGDISEYNALGVLVKDYGTLASIRDLEFDKSGNLWAVNDNSTNGIEEFNSSGNLVKTLTGYAASDVAPDNSGGIYVSHNNFSSDIAYFNSLGVRSTVTAASDGSGQMIYDNYTPPTPEPGALALLAGPAMAGMWVRRRRAKRVNK